MSNLTKLEFIAHDTSDNNYLSWILDVQIHLEAMNLEEIIAFFCFLTCFIAFLACLLAFLTCFIILMLLA